MPSWTPGMGPLCEHHCLGALKSGHVLGSYTLLRKTILWCWWALMIPLFSILQSQQLPWLVFLEASVICAHGSQSLQRVCSWGMVKRRELGPLCTPVILSCKRPRALCPQHKLWVLCGKHLCYSQPYWFFFFFSLFQRTSNWRMCSSQDKSANGLIL